LGPRLTAIVVETRQLFREALESLMRTHSYSVVSGARFVAELSTEGTLSRGAALVILGAQSADTAITEAASVRKLWSDSKIILLVEPGSPVDLDKLLGSEVDACVPVFVSADTLIRILDLIAATDARVLIMTDMAALPIPWAHEEGNSPAISIEPKSRPANEPDPKSVGLETRADASHTVQDIGASKLDVGGEPVPRMAPRRILPELSVREIQILNGLVKGHTNKVIARTCDITEATVKVHIRSILRKIRVGNRTQAAIWAVESGYSADIPESSH
jgi:two-component system nitrate/nitrite response regulator NarL